jgi:DNA-binding MarR family transcriptional regulator
MQPKTAPEFRELPTLVNRKEAARRLGIWQPTLNAVIERAEAHGIKTPFRKFPPYTRLLATEEDFSAFVVAITAAGLLPLKNVSPMKNPATVAKRLATMARKKEAAKAETK